MKTTMGERLQAALEWKGWTPPALISAARVSKGTVYNILNDDTKPEKIWDSTVTKLSRALGISATWLVSGEGDMIPESGDPLADVVIRTIPPRTHLFKRRLRPPGSPSPSVTPHETTPGYVRFHLLEGAGGMGAGALNEDYPEVVRHVELAEWEVRRKLGFLPAPGRIALLTGRGPSMRPMVDNGDVVMVDTAVTSFQGDAVYVININGETQIKMLQMRPGGLHIVSANPDYPAYPVTDADSITIGGKVVSVLGLRQV